MPSVQARQFTQLFRETFARSGRIDSDQLRRLESAVGDIADPGERAEANKVLALVKHDLELDSFETAPARKALSAMLGVTADRLPADLEKVLTHAVPAANVGARHYDLTFDFAKDGPTFPARARIDLDKPAGDDAILEVDSERLEIASVQVDGRPVPFQLKDNRLHVNAPGASSLEVRYTVKPTDDVNGYGLIRQKYSGAMWTLLWPDHTGSLFPSNSAPADGATATVTVKVQGDSKVIGPGAADGDTFSLKREVPAYAISFYAGRFKDVQTTESQGGVKVAANKLVDGVPDDVRKAYAATAADAVDFFSGWLGGWEYGKQLNLVEVDGAYGGMENAGAIAMMADSASDLQFAKKLAVHETSHHWFGDNVRIASWGDMWMSEGFARYAEFRYFRDRQGEGRFAQLLDSSKSKVASALRSNKDGLSAPDYTDPKGYYSSLPYELGCWMLRMVEGKLGTAQFDAVLKDWYQEHRFQAVSAKDFVGYVKDKTGQDFSPLFESWNNLQELPRLRDRSRVQGNKLNVNLEAQSSLPKGLELPVVLHGRNGERELRWVDPSSASTIEVPFEIARHEWDPERMVCASVW